MNKKFRFFGLIFAIMILIFVSACSPKSNQETNANVGENNDNASKEEEAVHLKIAFPLFYGEPADMAKVEAEVSKLAKEKINATVEIEALSISKYRQQMNLTLTSGEQLDLAIVLSDQLSPLVSRGQLHEIGDILPKHGQGIIDSVGTEYLKATQIDAKQFAVPTVREYAASFGFMMTKEYVDKYEIDVDQISTLEDMGNAFRKVKENEPSIEPLSSSGPGFSIANFIRLADPLSDFNGVLPNYDNDLKVVNYYEMPEYVEMLKTLRSWYKEGLILQDVPTTQITKDELVHAGKIFAYTEPLKPGIEEQNTRNMKKEMVAAEIVPPAATTTNVATIMWGVPRNSKNPEKAVELLNLLYSDKEFFNLLNWGIEGEHYEKVSETVIKYPEGVTTENVGYLLNTTWLTGNQFLSYTFENEDPELWEKIKQFNNDAIKSKALGFNFNSDPVRTELAAVTNVKEQFLLGLETGAVDFEKQYPEFIKRLEDAGMDKIIAEKQKQLDEWAKINGVK